MARTRAHAPIDKLLHDPTLRVERHDHRDGTCDLPEVGEFIAQMQATSWVHLHFTRRCVYELDLHAIPAPPTPPWWKSARTAQHRRARRKVRQQLHVALRDPDML